MNQLSIYLFGPPQLKLEGEPLHISRRKAMALLAYLAVTAQPHSRESLAALLFPENDPSSARAGLRRTLSSLNRTLGSGWLNADRETAYLEVQNNPSSPRTIWLDVTAFQEKLNISHSHNHPETRICPDCLSALEEAVDLYRKDFMAGFNLADCWEFEEWQFFKAEELRKQLAGALVKLSSHYAEIQEYDKAIQHAQHWLSLDSLNEAAHKQLMILYAQDGQRTAALRQYRECVRILDKELGVAPDLETDSIYKSIQTGELGGQGDESLTKPWFDRTVRHNLPEELTSFIGRQEQIEQVKAQVGSQRLVTLIGLGGVGKTRLALQSARALLPEFANGIWMVQLAPLTDPKRVPGTVATTLGLQESREISLEETLVAFLRAKHLLLVLDNCEHLVKACAQLVVHLLTHCPDLHILTTSREPLRVPGEAALRVGPLPLPQPEENNVETLAQVEAVQLFVERANRSFSEFSLTTANALAVREICCRLDGIPLALELAARWVQTLQVEQIAARIDDVFRLLTGGQRTALPRQQTMHATLDWSYNLLSTSERAALRRLSVFAGSWTLPAAEMVCCGDDVHADDVLQILNQLIEKSLVEVSREKDQETRYHLLSTIQQYAQGKLRDAGDETMARDSHMHWFAEFAERQEPQLTNQNQVESLSRLEKEHENLRAALTRASVQQDAKTSLQLSGALGRFWRIRGFWREGQRWLDAALTLDAETGKITNPRYRARAFYGMGLVTGFTQDCVTYYDKALHLYQEAGDLTGVGNTVAMLATEPWWRWQGYDWGSWKEPLEKSLAYFRDVENHSGMGSCLYALGAMNKRIWGDMKTSRDLYERSLAHLRVGGVLESMCFCLTELAWSVWDDGDLRRAQALMEEALQGFRVIGGLWGACVALRTLAWYLAFQGKYTPAREMAEEGVSIAREMGIKGLLGFSLSSLGQFGFFLTGEIEQAQTYLEEAVSLARDVQHLRVLGVSLSFLGNLHRRQGDLAQAAYLLDESLERLQEGNVASGLWRLQRYLGDLIRTQGDFARAEELYRVSLQMIEKRGRRLPDVPPCLDGLGMVAAQLDQYEQAVRLFGAAQMLREHMGIVIHPVDQAEYAQHLDLVRSALNETVFTTAWEAGLAMTPDQAIAYALDEDS